MLYLYAASTLVCAALLPCFVRRMSPWSTGRAVATTDQLNRYLAQYATPTTPQQPQEQPTPEAGPMGSGFGGMYGDSADQGLPPSPALPMGRDAPAYRPSLVSESRERTHMLIMGVKVHKPSLLLCQPRCHAVHVSCWWALGSSTRCFASVAASAPWLSVRSIPLHLHLPLLFCAVATQGCSWCCWWRWSRAFSRCQPVHGTGVAHQCQHHCEYVG
jgi:hypothetical protein